MARVRILHFGCRYDTEFLRNSNCPANPRHFIGQRHDSLYLCLTTGSLGTERSSWAIERIRRYRQNETIHSRIVAFRFLPTEIYVGLHEAFPAPIKSTFVPLSYLETKTRVERYLDSCLRDAALRFDWRPQRNSMGKSRKKSVAL